MRDRDGASIDRKPNVPHPARVYDYLLGGTDNFAADRQAGERLIQGDPRIVWLTKENRRFLFRVVRHLAAERGIRQFLDIGSGLPRQNNVHEVAQAVAWDAKVVYVDHDPMVNVHARAMLANDPHTAFVEGDLRRPEEILDAAETRRVIDFTQPVALLLFAILHFVPDTDAPFDIVARFRDALADGSYIALSHGAPADDEQFRRLSREVYQKASVQLTVRSPEQITRFFDGFDLEPPGLVPITSWRPDAETEQRPTRLYGGVANKAPH